MRALFIFIEIIFSQSFFVKYNPASNCAQNFLKINKKKIMFLNKGNEFFFITKKNKKMEIKA